MSTPPHDPNNPYSQQGGSSGGGYPQYPGAGGPTGPGGPSGPGGPGMPGGNFSNYNPGPPPPNHLAFAIVSTILCCWPLGIPAIIFATQVNTKWNQGDYQGAQESSDKAKTFAIWSVISVLIIYAILIVLSLAGVVTAATFGL